MNTRFRALISATIFTGLAAIYLWQIDELRSFVGVDGYSAVGYAFSFLTASLLASVLSVLTMWVIFFKSKQGSLFAVSLFPGLAAVPLLLGSESLLQQIRTEFGQIALLIILGAGVWLVSYLIILTTNVVNGLILYGIPLGMAGKASQFIFTLIATYLLLVQFFSSELPPEIRAAVLMIYTFAASYSACWQILGKRREVSMTAGAMSGVVGLAVLVISIWPLDPIWSALFVIVVYYMLLNIALETRQKLTNMIWVEYSLLISLVCLIIFTAASWGINGPLL
jgi:hypothetical protein